MIQAWNRSPSMGSLMNRLCRKKTSLALVCGWHKCEERLYVCVCVLFLPPFVFVCVLYVCGWFTVISLNRLTVLTKACSRPSITFFFFFFFSSFLPSNSSWTISNLFTEFYLILFFSWKAKEETLLCKPSTWAVCFLCACSSVAALLLCGLRVEAWLPLSSLLLLLLMAGWFSVL